MWTVPIQEEIEYFSNLLDQRTLSIQSSLRDQNSKEHTLQKVTSRNYRVVFLCQRGCHRQDAGVAYPKGWIPDCLVWHLKGLYNPFSTYHSNISIKCWVWVSVLPLTYKANAYKMEIIPSLVKWESYHLPCKLQWNLWKTVSLKL